MSNSTGKILSDYLNMCMCLQYQCQATTSTQIIIESLPWLNEYAPVFVISNLALANCLTVQSV